MLPPFIIEEIRNREQRERSRDTRPQLELPLPIVPPDHGKAPTHVRDSEDDKGNDRGVLILDIVG